MKQSIHRINEDELGGSPDVKHRNPNQEFEMRIQEAPGTREEENRDS